VFVIAAALIGIGMAVHTFSALDSVWTMPSR
jgi:hypothetical protein